MNFEDPVQPKPFCGDLKRPDYQDTVGVSTTHLGTAETTLVFFLDCKIFLLGKSPMPIPVCPAICTFASAL